MNQDILVFIEDKLNDVIDETEKQFNEPIAAELATAAATMAAQFAKAGGTSKKEFLEFMKTIYEEVNLDEFKDVSVDISTMN